MDPNACLAEIARLVTTTDSYDKRRRAELCRALVGWRGFEPDWKAHPEATKFYRAWVRKMSKFSDLAR